MNQLIIGVVGHIDHGKTALVRALNGFEGDSNDEEKRRGITIDLSFSSLTQNQKNISFIDVPGHEKLVKTMISGAFGFDSALLVVDAKEGLMPQSVEHLYVLELLSLTNIIVAISKIDLVSKNIVEEQIIKIKKFFKENFKNLEIYDILPVSIYDSTSIEALKNTLFSLHGKEKIDRGITRYYIDRTFSLKGIGTVVTGTILEGILKLNTKVYISELKNEYLIKNLQVHGKNVETATQGQRVAISLPIPHTKLSKGFLITQKGYIRGFNNADVYISTLPNKKIQHNSTMIFHAGTKQVEAKILYLNSNKESGFAKIEFKETMYLVFNEPFIITKNNFIYGGGIVINAINDPLKKITKKTLLSFLHKNDFKAAFQILINSHKKGFGLISSYQRFGLSHENVLNIAREIQQTIIDEKNLVVYSQSSLAYVESMIESIYVKNPYALLSATSISSKHNWISQTLAELALKSLEEQKTIKKNNGVYQSSIIKTDNLYTIVENKIFEILEKEDITPTAPYNIYDMLDVDRKIGDLSLKKLTSSKKVIRLAHNLFITSESLSSIMMQFREIIKTCGFIDISEAKKRFDISRKYLIAYLDYLDNFKDIKTVDNKRVFV